MPLFPTLRRSPRKQPAPSLTGPEPLESRVVPSALGVPAAPSIVSVHQGDYRLFVQDRLPDGSLGPAAALEAKGVNWSPDSVGTDPADLTQEYAKSYQTDIPLMAKMGVNVVRV